MPSFKHEALVALFRNHPELAADLLRDPLGVELPDYTTVRIDSESLAELKIPSRYADLVVLLDADGKPVFGIIVEVQLAEDREKRRAWAVYTTSLWARFDCDAVVLVVTVDDKVARWAAQPIRLGPGSAIRPSVIGPSGVPVVVDDEIAAGDPELAVLSAMAHGRGGVEEAVRVASTALKAIAKLPPDRALLYFDLIESSLSEAARKALEEMSQLEGYEWQSEFSRTHDALGRANALIDFLEGRDLAITEDQRQRILSCRDAKLLKAWARRAGTIGTVDELFREE